MADAPVGGPSGGAGGAAAFLSSLAGKAEEHRGEGTSAPSPAAGFLASLKESPAKPDLAARCVTPTSASRPSAPAAARPSAPARPNVPARPSGGGQASHFLSSLSSPAGPTPPPPALATAAQEGSSAAAFLASAKPLAPQPVTPDVAVTPALVPALAPVERTAADAFSSPGQLPPAGGRTASAFLSSGSAPPLTKRPAAPQAPPSAAQFLASTSQAAPLVAVAPALPPAKPTRSREAQWELSYRTLSGAGVGAAQTEATAAGREATSYCLALINVEGGALPGPVERHLREEKAAGRSVALSHQLLVSFFDCTTRGFFGVLPQCALRCIGPIRCIRRQ
eukprot:scaffold159588_cov26-Tisochrysis_lutea.AAC.7